VGAIGIAILKAGGVEFPIAIPPGIILLLVGALVVGLTPWRWAPGAGAFLGLFVTVGFLLSPDGLSNLAGDSGAVVALGQGIQQVGVITAVVAGVIATRAAYARVGDRPPPAMHRRS
jgi:hypothetical protein